MSVQSDIYTRLLGSVEVATGSPVYEALENYNTTILDDGALCFVRTGPGAGEWQLERASAAVADGTTIVAPVAGGPGRWIKRWVPGPPGPSGSAYYQTIQDNAGVAQTQQPIFQFTGSGVSVANDGPGTRTVITITSGSSFNQTIEDPVGTPMPQEPILQFTGDGLSVVDDPAGTRTVITVGGVIPAPTALYVNGTTGADTNPGTIGSPLATLTEALRRVGPVVRTYCFIVFTGAGTYDGSSLAHTRGFLDYLDILSDPSTEVVDLASTAITSSAFQTLTVAAAGWTVNAYAGLLARIITGAEAGEIRRVLSNTADTAILLNGFDSLLAPGDTFEFVHPGVVLSPIDNIVSDSQASLGLTGVEFPVTQVHPLGRIYCLGCTQQTGANLNSSSWQAYSGGMLTDTDLGFGWRKVGASPVGTLFVSGGSALAMHGNLGNVQLSTCSGQGFGLGVVLAGRMQLFAGESETTIDGTATYQATPPTSYLDDYANSNAPGIISGGSLLIGGPLVVGGTGANAGLLLLEQNAWIDQSVAITATNVSVTKSSRWNIGYAGNGGTVTNWLCDGENVFTVSGITWATVGDSFSGGTDSLIYRSV